jgi:hypothetical protein
VDVAVDVDVPIDVDVPVDGGCVVEPSWPPHSDAATAAATSAAAVIRENGAVAAGFAQVTGAPQNGQTHSFAFTWREQASHGCNFDLMALPQLDGS